MNYALSNRESLEEFNYFLNPSPDNNYWANISSGRLDDFVQRTGGRFNVTIVGNEADEDDFYTIPYSILRPILTEEYRTEDKNGRLRWILYIKRHQIRIGRYPASLNGETWHGNRAILNDPNLDPDAASSNDANDYAIENRRVEIQQRLKQSTFRKRVLNNFDSRCCLSGVDALELLVASHIVPWASRVDSRLDPGNGLLLWSGYDRLFDRGYISFADDLTVIVTPIESTLSDATRAILDSVTGLTATRPRKTQINPEYLAYHREHILKS